MKSPASVSPDGKYSLYMVSTDYYVVFALLLNNNTNETILIEACDETGFLTNDTLYIRIIDDYKMFNINGVCLFTLSDNFDVGQKDGKSIRINKVYKQDDGSYIVIWYDSAAQHNPDDANYQSQYAKNSFLTGDTYKVSVTDKECKVIKTKSQKKAIGLNR